MRTVSTLPSFHRTLAGLNGAQAHTPLNAVVARNGYAVDRRLEKGELAATVYRHKHGDRPVVLAFQGTNSAQDMVQNAQAWLLGKRHPQYRDAYRIFHETFRQYPEQNIVVTGHSLGGALTRMLWAGAVADEALRRRVQFVAFNAPAVEAGLYQTRRRLSKGGFGPEALTAYRHPFDPVAGLFPDPNDIMVRSGRPWPPVSQWVGRLEDLLRRALRRLNVHGIYKFV